MPREPSSFQNISMDCHRACLRDFFGMHTESAVFNGRRGRRTSQYRPRHAFERRLGDRSPGWRQIFRKAAFEILAHRNMFSIVRSARYCRAPAPRLDRCAAVLAGLPHRRLGLRRTRRFLCRAVYLVVHRPVPVHPHSEYPTRKSPLPSRFPCGAFCEPSTARKSAPSFGRYCFGPTPRWPLY